MTSKRVMTKFVNWRSRCPPLDHYYRKAAWTFPMRTRLSSSRADRFGLSDLYQLRGRVGRYKHQGLRLSAFASPRQSRRGCPQNASAPSNSILHSAAVFKIAMRDPGNPRGWKPPWVRTKRPHYPAVGFELYCQLLKQKRLIAQKAKRSKPRIEVQLRLDFLALSPTEESPKSQSPKSKARERDGPGSSYPSFQPRKHATRNTPAAPRNTLSLLRLHPLQIHLGFPPADRDLPQTGPGHRQIRVKVSRTRIAGSFRTPCRGPPRTALAGSRIKNSGRGTRKSP